MGGKGGFPRRFTKPLPLLYDSALRGCMGRVPYNTFMHSREWAAIRRAALERANHKCEWCKCEWADFVLHVHHKTYARFGGGELPDDLQVLCEVCHGEAHGRPYSVLMRTPRGVDSKKHSKTVKRKRRANHWKRNAARRLESERERTANFASWVGVSIKDRY